MGVEGVGYIVKDWVWSSEDWDLGLRVSHRMRLCEYFGIDLTYLNSSMVSWIIRRGSAFSVN